MAAPRLAPTESTRLLQRKRPERCAQQAVAPSGGTFPRPNAAGDTADGQGNGGIVAHYTQVVWKDTKEVGCGHKDTVWVCQYGPGGNMGGEFFDQTSEPLRTEEACDCVN